MLLYQGYDAGTKLKWETVGLVCCALGSAFIHTVGSRAILEKSQRGLIGTGIFIAFGALGVGLGNYLGTTIIQSRVNLSVWLILIKFFELPFLIYAAISIKKALKTGKVGSEKIKISMDRNDMVCLVMSLFAVLIYSYVRCVLPDNFKELIMTDSEGTRGLLEAMFPCFICFLGNSTGGVLVALLMRLFDGEDFRKMNYKYALFALVVAGLCLWIGRGEPVCVLIGTIFFHSVMPVTLYEIYCILHKTPAFSLGLATLVLLAGTLSTLMYLPNDEQKARLIAVFYCLVILALTIGYKVYSKKVEDGIRY